MRKNVLLFYVFCLGILLFSCQEEQLTEKAEVTSSEILKSGKESNVFIPYADTKTLESFGKDRELIDYAFARRLALIELQNSNFTKEMKWEGYTISERPVIIYGFDSKPKFYEFFMKDAEGVEKGSVKVLAKRSAPDILQEVSNKVKDYGALYAKGNSEMKIVEDWAGESYLGIVGKSGENVSAVIDSETGEVVREEMRELSEPEIYEEVAKNIENSEQEFYLNYEAFENSSAAQEIKKGEIKGGLQEQMDALKQEIEEEHKAREKYWDVVAECRDSIMTLSDAEIKEIYSKSWWSRTWKKLVGVRKTEKYEIPKFRNNFQYRYPRPAGQDNFCGPWALGWIYHSEHHEDLYLKFEDYYSRTLADRFGGKPMTPRGMWKAAKNEGKGKMYATPYFSTTREAAYNFIRDNKQPIIVLRKAKHYRVAYGCYKKKHGFWWTNYYFAVKDNGAEIDKTRTDVIYRRATWSVMFFVKTYVYSYKRYGQRPKINPIDIYRRNSHNRHENYRRPSPLFRRMPLARQIDDDYKERLN